MGIRMCTLSSGSNANCTYVEAGGARFLIDAGLSARAIERGLDDVGGCEPGDLDAILVTHEHRDHIAGVGVMGRRHGIPVLSNAGTRSELERYVGPRVQMRTFCTGRYFKVADSEVMPFPVSHDASEPVGFIIHHGRRRAVTATDMGYLHPMTLSRFKGAELLLFEANHDPYMLENGPYPEDLKRRIRSPLGHLSNDQSAQHLTKIVAERTRCVLLAHLSENNNTPCKALDTVGARLERDGPSCPELGVAPRYSPSRWMETD